MITASRRASIAQIIEELGKVAHTCTQHLEGGDRKIAVWGHPGFHDVTIYHL
jgi:hypothetical protein